MTISRFTKVFSLWVLFIVSLVNAYANTNTNTNTNTSGTGSIGPLNIEGVAIHRDTIVFASNGQLWLVSVAGGEATALTPAQGDDAYPVISKDGAKVAFTRRSTGRGDVYVLDLTSRLTTRLSFHPLADVPVAWSSDDSKVIFRSARENGRAHRLYQIAVNEQWPSELPLPFGVQYAFGDNDTGDFYVPMGIFPGLSEFRYYRGGMRAGIYKLAPNTHHTQLIVGEKYNAFSPMPHNNSISYISDQTGTHNLFVSDVNGANIKQLTDFDKYGVRFAALDGEHGNIAFARDGHLYTLNLASKQLNKLNLSVKLDRSLMRERRVDVSRWLKDYKLMPKGQSAILTARGDLFHFDLNSKKSTNLTKTPGVSEVGVAIAKNGEEIAYFSNVHGDNHLAVMNLKSKMIDEFVIEENPSVYHELTWSPNDQYLTFADQRLNLWLFDRASGKASIIDHSNDPGQNAWSGVWSGDGRYFAYVKRLDNYLPTLFVRDLKTAINHQITKGDIYAASPAFDQNGQYLYFMSSYNRAASDFNWSVLSAYDQSSHLSGNLNVVLLQKDTLPPVLPVVNQPNMEVSWSVAQQVTGIDFSEIDERIMPLGLPHKGLESISSLSPGKLLLQTMEWPVNHAQVSEPRLALYLYDLRNPAKLAKLSYDTKQFDVDATGRYAFYKKGTNFTRQDLGQNKPQVIEISIPSLGAKVAVAKEWQQIYQQSWHYLREQFYDENVHGYDTIELEKHYEKFLVNITNRRGLKRFQTRIFSHTSVSHIGLGSGDNGIKSKRNSQPGLLGADFEISEGRYRVTKIYQQGHYDLRDGVYGPLDQPGNKVKHGEYLISINGKTIDPKQSLYRPLMNMAGRTISLEVSANANGDNSRTIKVIPLMRDDKLRLTDWAENNRREVERQSDGQVSYLHIAGYNSQGIESFLRGYYSAKGKRGLIIDQRFNGGGITSDLLISMLQRKPLYAYRFRYGQALTVPVNSFEGKNVLLTNEWNASAAETFATMFQKAKLGTSVGRQTFGAGIGPWGFSMKTIDNANLQIPSRGAYMPDGDWGIENQGVPVMVEKQIWPKDYVKKIDPQLQAAIKEAMIRDQKVTFSAPEYPIHPGSSHYLNRIKQVEVR
jgi:tricorn protease